jgi:allantoinase
MRKSLVWPNGKKIAVSVTVMFEGWTDGKAPTYSVQTTHLKSGTVDHAGHAWSTYGGRVGVWRTIRMLNRLAVPATFFVNGICAERYPDAVKEIARSGHDIGAHAYSQDQLLSYMSLEEQRTTIQRCIGILEDCGGKKVTGWASPAVAFTPETAGYLAQAGLKWTTDVTYTDLPIRIKTPHGDIAGVPTTDFSDNRVLRSNPRDLYDTHMGTFRYLRAYESMSLLVLVIHCQFGGRPLIAAVIDELLRKFAQSRNIWFARHEQLADWALQRSDDAFEYRSRYLDEDKPAALNRSGKRRP